MNRWANPFAGHYFHMFVFQVVVLFTPPSLLFLGVGELVHFILNLIDKAILSILTPIESKTPTGTMGIIGFLLTAIGFILQFYGTWKGR